MAGLKLFRTSQLPRSLGWLGPVAARLATIGNRALTRAVLPPTMAARPVSGDALRIFPTHVLTHPPAASPWASAASSTAGVAAIGGMGVFDPAEEIVAIPHAMHTAGLGSPDLNAFVLVMSAALLIVAILRRANGTVAPVAATATIATPDVPKVNERYPIPDGITMSNMPPTGRSYVQGTMTMRPITPHGLVMYVTDSAGPRAREGFYLLRESDRLAPLFIPLESVRRAVLQGEIAQTPFRAPHEMPSVPFRDPVTAQVFHISPSWNLNPKPNAPQPYDPHAQIVGVVVKDGRGEVVLPLPWVDGWMTHSPMTYEPIRDSAHAWVAPKGWTGDYMTLRQRTEAAAALLERLPQLTHLTPAQEEALAFMAALVAGPQLDSGIARWAVNAVLQGRRSTVYLADQVADVMRNFPPEWMFDRPLDVGLDAQETFTHEILQTIEDCVAMTHHVFPALHAAPFLFPPEGGVRPYVPRRRVPRSADAIRPQTKK